MAYVLPEIALQRVLQIGLTELRSDRAAFDEIFALYLADEMISDYGSTYVDQIYKWFSETKIPVLQAWSYNTQRIPCVSIHLAQEVEDEQKAALGDDFGNSDTGVIGVNVFTTQLDIGIHTARTGDQVLWLYYIVSYVLFKKKLLAESLGMRLQTWSATDWNKDPQYMTDNIFSRWLRFRCTVQNFWEQKPLDGPFDTVTTDISAETMVDPNDL